MYSLDMEWLKKLGLDALSDEKKREFLQHAYSELETRVGEELTKGMSEAQLNEFGSFIEPLNEPEIRNWFAKTLPDYATYPEYQEFAEKLQGQPEIKILAEYGATKWLYLNRPDYQEIVGSELQKLESEISANAASILASSGAN